MKDKRQRMAFTWPYGDPQVLAYMLSAVAASGYNSGGNVPIQSLPSANEFSNQNQQNNIPFQSQSQKNECSLDQVKSHEPINSNYSSGPIMNEMQIPLHLNIKTPSPNTTHLSESYSSSSSSFTSSHYMPINGVLASHQNSTPFHNFSNTMYSTSNNKISSESISPISLFIPNSSKQYSNYDSQFNLLIKPNQTSNQNKNIPSFMPASSSLSFKSPAFGLADSSVKPNLPIDQQINGNSNLIHAHLTAPVETGYSSFVQSAQRSC